MKLSIKWVLIGGFLGLLLLSITTILASSYLTSEKILQGHAKEYYGEYRHPDHPGITGLPQSSPQSRSVKPSGWPEARCSGAKIKP